MGKRLLTILAVIGFITTSCGRTEVNEEMIFVVEEIQTDLEEDDEKIKEEMISEHLTSAKIRETVKMQMISSYYEESVCSNYYDIAEVRIPSNFEISLGYASLAEKEAAEHADPIPVNEKENTSYEKLVVTGNLSEDEKYKHLFVFETFLLENKFSEDSIREEYGLNGQSISPMENMDGFVVYPTKETDFAYTGVCFYINAGEFEVNGITRYHGMIAQYSNGLGNKASVDLDEIIKAFSSLITLNYQEYYSSLDMTGATFLE